MDSIKDIIPGVIKDISGSSKNSGRNLEEVWPSLLEEKAKPHIKLAGIKGGEVVVYADSPAWLYYLRMNKRKILGALKKEFPDIENIRLSIGKD